MIIHLSWAKKVSYSTHILFGAVPNFIGIYFFLQSKNILLATIKWSKFMYIYICYLFKN